MLQSAIYCIKTFEQNSYKIVSYAFLCNHFIWVRKWTKNDLHCYILTHFMQSLFFTGVDLTKPVSMSVHMYMYLRMSVGPQKVLPIRMKFGMEVEVDEWFMMVCRMTQSKVKMKVVKPWKLEISSIFKIYLLHHFQWELANDCWLLN